MMTAIKVKPEEKTVAMTGTPFLDNLRNAFGALPLRAKL